MGLHLTGSSLTQLNNAFVSHGTTDPGPTLTHGTEYVWFQTDGTGNVLDILSGVA